MTKSAHLNIRIEPGLKEQGEEVLSELGLSPTELITLTYRQLVMRKGLPFDVRIPNVETIEAINEPRTGLKRYTSSQAMIDDILNEDD